MAQPNTSLEDTLQTIPSNSFVQKSDGDAGVMGRIESILGGEAAEDPPVTEDVAEETDSEEAEETPTDAETTESDEASEEDEGDEEEAVEEEEETAEETETLELTEDQLAGILGLPEDGAKVDDEGKLLIRTKVDGEVSFVPLKDLTTSYQLEKHLRQKSQADADARREFESYKAEETAKLQQSVTEATGLALEMEKALQGEVAQVNWDQLRQTNPAEWAAKQREFELRKATVDQAKSKLQQTIQAQQEEYSRLQQEAQQAKVLEETEKLVAAVPQWADGDIAKKELGEIQRAVSENYGFTQEEMDLISDHRLVLLLRDAVKGRSVADPEPAKKKLKVVPRIVKSGSRNQKSAVKQKAAETAKQTKLKKTGSTQDAAALIYDML